MNFSRIFLGLIGWKVIDKLGKGLPNKAVVLSAPHTSNWDFFIGFFSYRVLGIKAHYLIKEEAFFFPMGGLLKKVGGIPVRRGKNNVVMDVLKEISNNDKFLLTIAPEGKRKAAKEWKSGYHRIALKANIPIVMGYVDYKKKECGLMGTYDLKGDLKQDTLEIMKYYKDVVARHPEQFYLPPEVFE